LLAADRQDALADALFATSRIWPMELHFQKALAGAPPEAIAATRDTAINPAVLDAFVLVIIGSEGAPAYPGLEDTSARQQSGEPSSGLGAKVLRSNWSMAPVAIRQIDDAIFDNGRAHKREQQPFRASTRG
jgi:hypothetical protein